MSAFVLAVLIVLALLLVVTVIADARRNRRRIENFRDIEARRIGGRR